MSDTKHSGKRFQQMLEAMDGTPNPQVKAMFHRGGGGVHIKDINKIKRRSSRREEQLASRGIYSEE